MGIKYISLIIFIFYQSYVHNEIIKMNSELKNLKNITTKLGLIIIERIDPPTYYFESSYESLDPYEYLSLNLPDEFIFKIENVLNANLYSSSLPQYKIDNITNNTININTKSNSLSIDFICELLYRTKYIDKFVYSLDNENNIYIGGTPEYLIKNHNNYTFGDKPFKTSGFESIVSNINIEINNKNKFKLNLYDQLLFNYDKYKSCTGLICLREQDFKKFKEQFNNFTDYYNYNFIKNNYTFSISFKISDKTFNIILNGNPYDYIVEDACFSLGEIFLNLFDYREYDLEDKSKVNFYLNKNKTNVYIYPAKLEDSNIIYSNFNYDFIVFCIVIFLTILTVLKTYDTNQNLYIKFDDYYGI